MSELMALVIASACSVCIVADVGRDGLQCEDADAELGGTVLGDQVAAGAHVAAPRPRW
ncbi:hypothetical protein ACIQF6_34140 [Kitasatospora sp. NPDC092948]|uniref:hypothetical protein n=1 Tax=Kitasatospora sp. NPDC092948 TaxID=3364088 RepID=UPI0038140825